MTPEGSVSLKERGPLRLFSGIRQKIIDIKSYVDQFRFDYETQKQGAALIVEARDLLRQTRAYNLEQQTIYRESSGYLSIERPMNIGAEFTIDGTRYSVRVTEAQGTDPLALRMLIKDTEGPMSEPDTAIYIDVRGDGFSLMCEETASRGPKIYFRNRMQEDSDSTEEKPREVKRADAVRDIRQSLAVLREQLGLPKVSIASY